jgi:hypothetical protein
MEYCPIAEKIDRDEATILACSALQQAERSSALYLSLRLHRVPEGKSELLFSTLFEISTG